MVETLSLAPSTFVCAHCGVPHAYSVVTCPSTGKHLKPTHKLEGTSLDGKYTIARIIAEGGMGVVYEGKHIEIGRKVAIKFLHSAASATPEMLERFRNEARIAAAVGHRNIVTVLDMGTTPEGIPYIVMEHLEGSDLGDFLDAAVRLPRPWAVDIAIQILSALRPVHQRNVVHRDLKPANILLVNEPDGSVTVKLLDFGVSRLASEQHPRSNSSRDGAVFGTPRYMSPEQARGSLDLDHRADLYSAGVILYRMLTGAFPFEADTPTDLLPLIVNGEPVHVGRHGLPIPPGLAAVVMWALARDPAERFQDADEFIEALMPYRVAGDIDDDRDETPSTPPPSGSDPGWGVTTPTGNGHPESSIQAGPPAAGRLSMPSGDCPTVKPEDGVSYPSLDVPPVRLTDRSVEPAPAPCTTTAPASPGTRPDGGGRHRVRLQTLMFTALVLLALGITSIVSMEIGRLRSVRQALPGIPPGASTLAAPRSSPPGGSWKVTLDGLPDHAEVSVDGVVHPERPVVLTGAPGPRRLSISAPGHVSWERKVMVATDFRLAVDLPESPAP